MRGTCVMRMWAMLAVLGVTCAVASAQPKQPAGPGPVTVLRMAPGPRNWTADATIWRYYEVWQTDVARLASGKLVRVDPYHPREGFSPTKIWGEQNAGRNSKELSFPVQATDKVVGSAPPPADWMGVEFDDGDWPRTAVPMSSHYRALSMVCLRGKFEVTDPAAVKGMSLQGSVQGGAVVYLNGKEIARANLPAGELKADTLAEEYPRETFVHPGGTLLLPQVNQHLWMLSAADHAKTVKDPAQVERYQKRFRPLEVKVPGTALRQGTNVLAVVVYRAAADEAMFSIVSPKEMGYNIQDHRNWWWNRCSVETLTLTADAPAAAVVGRVGRPKGVQVWNWPAWERVSVLLWGDPAEGVKPIRLSGARNGEYSGQVVVSATQPVANLTAQVGDLAGPGGAVIGKDRLSVRYPAYNAKSGGVGFDTLEDAPPPAVASVGDRYNTAVMQPVWLTVRVPRDAAAGDYSGTLTVKADGLPATAVPVQLHVSGYVVPDPKDFRTHMGFVQSPETLAIRYDVPMWSEAHWKLIDRSFAVLGSVGTKELTIPLLRRTHFGNEHAMVWWVRQPDGSMRPDLSMVERYIDTAVNQLGKVPVVIFYVSEGEDGRTIPWITEFDPATGELKDAKGPASGSEEARAFWRPAMDGFAQILATHGIESSFMFGYHADGGNGPECAKECIDDLKVLAPEARWVRLGHFWFGHQKLDKGPNGRPWGRVGLVGNYGVMWDPETDKPFYGWQNPHIVTAYTRGTFNTASPLRDYRLCAEAILLTGKREAPAGWGITDFAGQFGRETFLGMRGFAPWGGDYWPVLKGRGGWSDIIARHNDPAAAHWDPRSSWSTTSLNNYQVTFIVGEGADGPVATVRSAVMRESLQEAEARIFVQNALLDEATRARLGEALAGRAKRVCDQRTRELRYLSEFTIATAAKEPWPSHYLFNPAAWQERSRVLYDLAGEVEAALRK